MDAKHQTKRGQPDDWDYKGEPIPLSLTGYIHEAEASDSFIIPFGIILIIWDYVKLFKFKWDQINTCRNVKFPSDETLNLSSWGIVIGDIVLSRNIYKKYSYSIKIDQVGSNSVFYGFVAAPFTESVLDWDTYFCVGGNRKKECGKKTFAVEVWRINHWLTGYGGKYVIDHRFCKNIENTSYSFKKGDIFKCEVDFDTEVASFFVGDHTVTHDIGKSDLIPSFCGPSRTIISLHEFDCVLR